MPNGVLKDAFYMKGFDPVLAKRDDGYNAIRDHFEKIQESDAILVCNFTKNGIENYIGANTSLEMGYAHGLGKPIYVMNPLPNYKYINDEILSFGAKILNGELSNIAYC